VGPQAIDQPKPTTLLISAIAELLTFGSGREFRIGLICGTALRDRRSLLSLGRSLTLLHDVMK
jgi:hypothetical protein